MNAQLEWLGGGITVAPGVYDAFTARLVEAAGFRAAYLSGAGVSYSLLGAPDIGLVSLSEMAERVQQVVAAVQIPVIVDGDNGHGNALNLIRTVQLFERAGARAVQFEDQSFPKRCGHLAGKRLVPVDEMVLKIRAAVFARQSDRLAIIARTDARSEEGLEAAIARARAYREAGADLLFVEAPLDAKELARVAEALRGAPLVANMVEGGKTPLTSAAELEQLGYALAIFPNSLLRCFAAAARELLTTLRTEGTTAPALGRMVSFDALNQIVGLERVLELEQRFVPATVEPGALC